MGVRPGAGGGDEGERTSGSSPLGMYFGFWKTRLLTIESGLPGEGQASVVASASAVTAAEAGAGAGPRAESGGEAAGAVAVAERAACCAHVDPHVKVVARVRVRVRVRVSKGEGYRRPRRSTRGHRPRARRGFEPSSRSTRHPRPARPGIDRVVASNTRGYIGPGLL